MPNSKSLPIRWTAAFSIILLAFAAIGSISNGNVSTSVTLTSGVPVVGAGGNRVALGTSTGNTTTFASSTGALTPGDCVSIDANGNFVDSGIAGCGGSGAGKGGIVVYSAASLSLTGTQYIPIGGGGLPSSTETSVDTSAPSAATVTNMDVQISSAPGVGNSIVFTWRKNTVSQSLTCTISGAVATSCNDSTHSFLVVQGDLLTIQLVTTGIIAGTPNLVIATQFGTTGSNGTVNTATQFQIGEFLANGTAISGVSIPNCPDSGGNHVNFASGTGVFTCGTSGGGTTVTVAEPYLTIGAQNIGPIAVMTLPTATTFVWRNQGTASVVNTNGSTYLNSGAGTSGYNWRIREVTKSPPYTVDFTMKWTVALGSVQDYAAICLVESGSGKLESFHLGYDYTRIGMFTWASVTALSAVVFDQSTNHIGSFTPGSPYHLRVVNDSVNRSFWFSADHINYVKIFTEASGTFITEDRLGFCVNTQGGATENVGMTAFSWLIGP